MKRIIALLTFTLISGSVLFAQSSGDKYFDNGDYRGAILAYKREVKSDPAKYWELAESYFSLQMFSEAADAMRMYVEKGPEVDRDKAKKWIALVERDDMPIEMKNMGENINTEEDELVPRISADGKILYFNSENRKGGNGKEDTWYVERQPDGSWGKAKCLYQLNTTGNEGLLSISPDGNVAVLFGHFKGSFGKGDLFYSVKTPSGWSQPCNLGGAVNGKTWESLAAIGPDGKTLIFTTQREDGKGSYDLYVTQLSEKGWSTPKNLGTMINTSGEEKYPFISADGKTLYFSSSGHFGFGGSDLFMSKRLDDTWTNWSEPVNLGKYINTLGNDMDFSVPASGIKGYIVKRNAPGAIGGNDIYEFYLPSQFRPEQVYNLYGRVSDEKDSNVLANIRFYDFESGEEVAKATTDLADGMYKVALPKNKKYKVIIDMKGYLYYETIVDLTEGAISANKEPFSAKLQSKQGEVDRIQKELDEANNQLKSALASGNTDIQKEFDRVENIVKKYKKALRDLEDAMAEAKYHWLEEEGKALNIRRDFKLQSVSVGAKFELKNIFFEFGSSTLTKESEKELDKLVDIMSKSEIVIELGGYTDSIGSESANKKLSQERVNSVKTYLVGKGVNERRLQAVGYGEENPVASNSTEEGRAMNRRVEVKIISLKLEREGGEEVTEEDKKDKKKEEPVAQEAEKGNMLELLQKAAKNGGLPSGSDCNTNPNPRPRPNPGPGPQPGPFNPDGLWSNFKLTKHNYILKSFNISLVSLPIKVASDESDRTFDGSFLGGEVSFVNKKLRKHAFQYYFNTPDSVGIGVGYTTMKARQFGRSPLVLMTGLDLKFFNGKILDMEEEDNFGYIGIPLGLRYMYYPNTHTVVSPEFLYQFNFNSDAFGGNNGLGFGRIGVNARWRLFHAGAHLNFSGPVQGLGFRAGVSF